MCCLSDSDSDMMSDSSQQGAPDHQESLLLSTIQSSLTTTLPDPDTTSLSGSSSSSSSPSTLIPEMSLDTIFMAGFLDCAQEAINFLTEVEKVSYDDATIRGLRQHLRHREHRIRTSPYSPGSRRERRNRQRKRSESELRRSLSMDDLSTLTQNANDSGLDEGYSSILLANRDFNGSQLVDSDDELELEQDQEPNIAQDSHESHTEEQEDRRVDSLSDSIDSSLGEETVEETRELPDLAVLAQENPAIAEAAHELLLLLEEELQDSTETDLSLLQSLCS